MSLPMLSAGGQSVRYYISGLPESATEDALRQHFIRYGNVVSVSIVMGKETGVSRGFGYLEMADNRGQDTMLQDAHHLDGKAISVMLTKDSLVGYTTNKVHLGRLPLEMSAEPIRETFSQFGVVLDVHLPKDPRTGERKNFGFVTFGSEEAVKKALAAANVPVGGAEIAVSPAAQSRTEMFKDASSTNWTTPAAAPWGAGCSGNSGLDWNPYSCNGGWGADWDSSWWGGGWGCDEGKGSWDSWGPGCAPVQSGKGSDAGWSDAGSTTQRKKNEGTRYFLPGLPESVGEYELREHFSRYGVVLDVAIVKDGGTGRSRGFGYVTMQDASTREAIISATHEFEGRPVTVMLTKDSLTGTDVKKVHLSKVSVEVTPEEIRTAFMAFGTVLDVHTPKDPRTAERKNFAFVTFDTQASFDAAIAAGSTLVRGQEVVIRPAAQCREHPGGGGGGCSASSCGGCGETGCGGGWDPSAGKGADFWGGCWSPGGCWGAGGADYSWSPPAPTWGCGGGKGIGSDSYMPSLGTGRSQAPAGCGCEGQFRPDHAHAGKGPEGGAKFFISGLPDWVTEAELTSHFSNYGTVSFASVVKDKYGEKSRGFGYVTLADSKTQEAVLCSQHIFGTQQISVMLTKESLTGNVKKVHLGNLNTDVQVEAIRTVFSQFGVVLDVHTPKDPTTGERRNYGFVSFSTDEAFQLAISAGHATIGECQVTIRPAAQSRTEPHASANTGVNWDASSAGIPLGGKGASGCCPGGWCGKGGKTQAWGGGWDNSWDSSWDSGWDPSWQTGPWAMDQSGMGMGMGMWPGKGYGEASWGCPSRGPTFGPGPWGVKGMGGIPSCGGSFASPLVKGGKWGCPGKDWSWGTRAAPY